MKKGKSLAKRFIEELGGEQDREITALQGVFANKAIGQNAFFQTASGALVNILALGAPEDTVISNESYKVSKNEYAIAQKMKAKGYKYAVRFPGDERLLFFKSAREIGPFIRKEYKDVKPEWNGPIEDLTLKD